MTQWTREMEADLQRLRRAEHEAKVRELADGCPKEFTELGVSLCLAEGESNALHLSEQGRWSANGIFEALARACPREPVRPDFHEAQADD